MTKFSRSRLSVAVVTGGARGIGLCIAQQFIQNGLKVVIADSNAVMGKKAQKKLGPNAIFVTTDVSREQSVKKMIALTVRTFGQIDYVINNAAIAKNGIVEKLAFADWKKVLDVNLSSAFLCAKYAARYLRKTQGVIVNIASTRAIMSEANTEAYSASKAGLVGLTHSLAISLGPEIRVNCISPGWIDTRQFMEKPTFPPLTQADHVQHPAGRVGCPDDIAAMVLYLCSEAAAFITGQNFIIDGGMTKKMIYM